MNKRSSLLRTAFSVTIILSLGLSTAESQAGEIRDGEVHHEGVGTAVSHHDQAGPSGEHGHEHQSQSDRDEHGEGHQHGTSLDHCTHLHAVGITTTISYDFSSRCESFELMTTVGIDATYTNAPAEPPRA